MAALGLAGLVVAVDISTKTVAAQSLETPIALVPGLSLELGYNSGVAFGALSQLSPYLLVALSMGIAGGLAFAVWRQGLAVPWPAGGLLLGGALSNMVDRIEDGRVTDFIDVVRWPAFNLADVAITVALIWMALQLGRAPGAKPT